MSTPEEQKTTEVECIEMQVSCQKSEEDETGKKEEVNNDKRPDIVYGVDDVPPWHVTLLLAIQHYVTMCAGAVIIPYLLAPKMCIRENDPARGYLISTALFVSGIGTFLQTTLGLRLPLIQGPSGAFLIPTFVILNFPQWRCPDWSGNFTQPEKEEDWQELWQVRMREIQGSVILASLVEVGIGITGIIGVIKMWITPLVVTPIISLIALSFLREVSSLCSGNWGIAFSGMFLMTLFSQYLKDVNVPYFYLKQKKCAVRKFPLFKLYPVLLSILIVWALCAILTAAGSIPPDSPVRTDRPSTVMDKSPWFRFPYPVQWGVPTITGGAVIGMIVGVLSSTVESVGDYHAIAKMSGVAIPPVHAINRGIFIEGICCILGGLWGTGGGLTSYSTNIAVVGITKVASRRVVQYTAIIMMLLGTCGKFSAMFLLIPPPVLGGVFSMLFGLICSVGLSNLQYIDLNSSRNLYILGSSLFLGLCIPQWLKEHRDAIQTGSPLVDQVLSVVLTTSMAVGGILGFVLDSTIPGTDEERGLLKWRGQSPESSSQQNTLHTYNIPFCKKLLEKKSWFAYIPISPTFTKYPASQNVAKVFQCFRTGKKYPVQEGAKQESLHT